MSTRILEETYIEADKKLINYQPPGLFGMFAARGLGGGRCFSTGATVYIKDGKLTVANIGDVKAILGNSDKVQQLSVDHVGSDEDEQQRIQEAVIACLKEKEDVTAKIAIRAPENFFQYGDACTYPAGSDTGGCRTWFLGHLGQCPSVWRNLTTQEAMEAAKSSSKGVEGAAEAVLGAAARCNCGDCRNHSLNHCSCGRETW
ncbi:hypothetical protein CYMTET_6157 [Cymbomonas tetramitiformis]|uniref:PPM-type phosphatase domain-containing protein n=1 Tax=Cymbomonas tetramitiformis TaxID=36881 RepID=A0AAE0LIC4_9CHLO|nr:hypothetical protein CYMTET_6157 [Cymbomonas tetramitiformis]